MRGSKRYIDWRAVIAEGRRRAREHEKQAAFDRNMVSKARRREISRKAGRGKLP